MILRPYQREAINAAYAAMRASAEPTLIVLPTGAGKSAVIATMAKEAVQQWGGRVLILSHVRELIGQVADTIRRVWGDAMAPVGIYSAGLKSRDTSDAVICAGIQSVFKRACELGRFDMILVDECFVAGTLIDTPSGRVAVESLLPGDSVMCAFGPALVTASSARPALNLITLEFTDGSYVTCTDSHPFFTDSGWVPAGELVIGSRSFSREELRLLWEHYTPVHVSDGTGATRSDEGVMLEKNNLLLHLLLEEASEPDVRSSRKGEGASSTAKGQVGTDPQRWEREIASAAAFSLAARPGGGAGAGTCSCDGNGAGIGAPETLQAGYSEPTDASCNRSGRDDACAGAQAPGGLQKNVLSGERRVASVTRLKPESARLVYNVQIDRHPSYFANGSLVHNCHLIPKDGDGMYRQFLADARVINPNVRLVGLTATDFRLDCGYIHGEGKLFGSVCYEAKVRDLINQGFLCALRGKNGGIPDLSGVHMRGGEYIPGELEDVMAETGKVNAACDEILRYGSDRNAWLVFCCGVKHADMVSKALTARGIEAPVVLGDTPSDERADLIGRYKAKSLRCLVSVGVLTTGFDAPHVDLIALLRPTQSPGLYCQMVGRGLRIEAGKKDCLVLDMAGVITEHGPVDDIEIREKRKGTTCDAPVKTCPQCQEILPAAAVVCNGCGFAFPRELAKHDTWAHDVSPLVEHKEEWVDVTEVDWSVHIKKKHNAATGKSEPIEGAPQTLRVNYTYGYHLSHSEWVCFGHSGFARTKAESWWQEVTGLEGWSAPASALAALDALDALRDAKELHVIKRLLLQTGGKFADIVGREYHSRDGERQPGDDQEEEAPKRQTLKQAVAAYAANEEIPF